MIRAATSNTIVPLIVKRVVFETSAGRKAPSPFLEALLALATNTCGPARTCVVVPESDGVAELVACLASLQFLATDWPQREGVVLAKSYPDRTWLRSIKDGRVFLYRGEEAGGRSIKLQYSDSVGLTTQGTFTVPREMLLQLEPTARRRPVAKSGKPSSVSRTFYDLVCGSSTYANSANIWNRVVLLGSSMEFQAVLDTARLTFAVGNGNGCPDLLRDFIWGAVTDDGRTVATEPRGGLGEPLVAVTRDPLLVKSLVQVSEPARQRLLVSSRIELALNYLDAIQTFSEKNRVLLLVRGAQRESAIRLRELGWIVWEPDGRELPVTKDHLAPHPIRGLSESERALSIDLKAGNVAQMAVQDGSMSRLFEAFSQLGPVLRSEEGEDDPQLITVAEALNDVFFRAASWLRVPPAGSDEWYEDAKRSLENARELLAQTRGAAAACSLDSFLDAVASFERNHPAGTITGKGSELLRFADLASSSPTLRHLFVCASKGALSETMGFLASEGRSANCGTLENLKAEQDLFRVVPVSIFSRVKFSRLLDPAPANQLMLVGYDFELAIYSRRIEHRNRSRQGLSLSKAERSATTGMPESFFRPVNAQTIIGTSTNSSIRSVSERILDLEIAGLERFVKTRRPVQSSTMQGDHTTSAIIVNFTRNSWAALAPEHMTLVIGKNADGAAQLEPRRAADLADGHRLVMRDTGSKDVVREMAEELMGRQLYGRLRHAASLWQRALVESGHAPDEIGRRLAEFGVSRSQMTLKGWLRNPSYIGPKSPEDVHAIAEAFPIDGAKEADWLKCIAAITEVRGFHLRAGTELTRLIGEAARDHLVEAPDHELPVQTARGRFWILQVADIDREPTAWPTTEINRLSWYDKAARERIERIFLATQRG